MIRDNELQRLIKYAQGLGLKVTIYNRNGNDCVAEWTLDGTEISLYAGKQNKIDLVLSMIHELGHHLWFVHERNRQPDLKFEEAVDAERDDTPKHLRKRIYDNEAAATLWWESIYKETNLKFPIYKLYAQKEYDVWMYEVFYETGKFPKRLDKRKKMKELNQKYRGKA